MDMSDTAGDLITVRYTIGTALYAQANFSQKNRYCISAEQREQGTF